MADTERVNLRLTADEKRELQRRAKAEGGTIADTVRGLLANAGGESTRVDASDAFAEVDALGRYVPLESVRPSGTVSQEGRRARFDDEDLAQLAASIKAMGILEPIVVREHAGDVADGAGPVFEIVAGERRWRAAHLAGLDAVPVVVGDWTDEQAVAAQLAENLQRQGLHPLDEARGLGALVDDHGWPVARVCAEVGRSRSYVYGRLRLLSLHDDCQAALEAGEINATVARCVATVPRALQPDALKRLRGVWGDLTTREAEDIIEREYRRHLDDGAEADFDPADGSLVARWTARGVSVEREQDCLGCQWNTSNDPSLGGQPDMCVQPACFDGKRRQANEELLRRAEKEGRKVVRGEAGDFAHGQPKRTFVTGWELDDVQRRMATQPKADRIEPALLLDPASGRVFEAIPRAELPDVPDPHKEVRAKAKKKEKAVRLRIEGALLLVEDAIPDDLLLPATWRALLRLLVEHTRCRMFSHVARRLAKQRWEGVDQWDETRDGAWVSKLSDANLVRFAAEMCAAHDAERAGGDSQPERLLRDLAAAVDEAGGFA